MVITLAPDANDLRSIHLMNLKNFFFLFFSLLSFYLTLFLHVCFNDFSALSLSVSRNAYILCGFHPINNQIPDPDGSSDIERSLQLVDKFIVSDVCEFAELCQPSLAPVPCLGGTAARLCTSCHMSAWLFLLLYKTDHITFPKTIKCSKLCSKNPLLQPVVPLEL